MPGGKQKLKALFTSRLQVGAVGTDSVLQILSGSATIVGGDGISACGARIDGGINACVIGEITVSDLNPCDMMFAAVWGTTACLMYKGEIIAGDGQASIVMRYTGCEVSMDAGWAGTARYIAFQIT